MMKQSTDKWRFAIGTTSRVPHSGGLHYFIADIDGEDWSEELVDLVKCAENVIIQGTDNGWHIYTDWVLPFSTLQSLLKYIGADKRWIDIGAKRGYYFLADKRAIVFSWPVEHMILHHSKNGKEKT